MITYTKKTPGFDALKFVVSATSDDQSRPFLSGILVEDGHAVATDGRRLHRAPTDLASGQYNLVSLKANEIVLGCNENPLQFPNWKRVAPFDLPLVGKIDLSFCGLQERKLGQLTWACIKLFEMTGAAINVQYLADLAPLGVARVHQAEAGRVVHVASDRGMDAWIMPLAKE